MDGLPWVRLRGEKLVGETVAVDEAMPIADGSRWWGFRSGGGLLPLADLWSTGSSEGTDREVEEKQGKGWMWWLKVKRWGPEGVERRKGWEAVAGDRELAAGRKIETKTKWGKWGLQLLGYHGRELGGGWSWL